ncbi:MAG: DEAD/DEAH box helicase [Vicinamibacterales bacterium]
MSTTRLPQLRCGDLVRIRGERWRIDRQVSFGDVATIDAAGCGPSNRGERARFLLPFELFDRLHPSTSPRLVGRARWRHVARCTLAAAAPAWSSLRAATHADLTLLPFQLEPAMALVRGDGCRFLIADAVGLGKTVEAGLMIAETLQRRPGARVLVISPAGLRDQWRDELRHRFNLAPDILDAAGLARVAARLPVDVNPWAVQSLVITSIDYIKRPEVMRSLEALTWDVVVLDEAHHLTGRSDRASAAAMLGDRARVLVLLTATPHSGDDRGFARLCSLGTAGGTEPLVTFRRTRDVAGLRLRRRTPLLRVRPTAAEAAMHDALMAYARLVWSQSVEPGQSGARLAVSVLARRACSSASSLARSLERRLALLADVSAPGSSQPGLPFIDADNDDEEPLATLQWPGLRDDLDERRRLSRLLQLARTAASGESKIAALTRFVSRVAEPAIVFTEYRDTLQRIASALPDVDAVQLHGGLTLQQRADALRRFTHGTARLLLATDTGSEGLNLQQRCRLVVSLELPWTPLRLEQRAGRVDRIGQERRVHAVHLVAADTCEEATLARLVLRIRRLRGVMSLLTRIPDEQRVAESILGQHPGPDLIDEAPLSPPGIATLDVRGDAQAEALRIGRARAFSGRGRDVILTERAVITRIRRRRPATAPQCLWIYKVMFTTSAGRLVWEALVPVRADVAGIRSHSRAFSGPLTRAVLNPDMPALQHVLADRRDQLLRQLHGSTQLARQRWSGRECDLMAVLRARHARLSAGLLQRGLFDRRDERLAAAQTSLLDAALSRSEHRLRDLAQADDLRTDTSELVFAVLLE